MISQTQLTDKAKQFLRKYFKNYKETNDPYEKLLVYEANEIIGIISYSIIYERAEINYIAVSNEYRNRGIATKLLTRAIDDIKKHCISISLEVNANNTPAINLYSKFNFKIQTIRKNYYGNQDGYLMIKEIR